VIWQLKNCLVSPSSTHNHSCFLGSHNASVCLTASFLSTRLRPSGVISNIICSRSPTQTLFCDFCTVTPLVVLAVVSYLGNSKKFLIDWLIDWLVGLCAVCLLLSQPGSGLWTVTGQVTSVNIRPSFWSEPSPTLR